MNRKRMIIISITGIVLVTLIMLGLTYAYFMVKVYGNNSDKSLGVTLANLQIKYADNNDVLTGDKIEPGVILPSKTFTVSNIGDGKVNDYAVYLENVVNTFSIHEDIKYTLSCSSNKGNECNGVDTETTFPNVNGLIVTNDLEVGEIHTYVLTVQYKETGVDQSIDMGKTLSAKIQIYALQDIVDVNGAVNNASTGDYVEMQSNPKTSQIVSNEYLIPAVEPGEHTIYVKDKDGNVIGEKKITIKRASGEIVDGTVISVTPKSQVVNIDITKNDSSIDLDIKGVSGFNPYSGDKSSLAYNIINNAQNETNGTMLLDTPLTNVAEEITTKTSDKVVEVGEEKVLKLTIGGSYIKYISSYVIQDGVFNYNPASCSSISTSCYESLSGKYVDAVDETIFSNVEITTTRPSSGTTSYSNSSSELYKIIDASMNDSNEVIIKYKKVIASIDEKTLSKTSDDYGTSYYYRGSVEDNYVDFAGMCWRAVRIQGDGSVKLVLEDQDNTCSDSDGNWNIANGKSDKHTTSYFDWNRISMEYKQEQDTSSGVSPPMERYVMNQINYVSSNVINGSYISPYMAGALEKFKTNKIGDNISKLKIGGWCLDDSAYLKGSDYTKLSADELKDIKTYVESYQENEGKIFYGSYKRLNDSTKSPSLVCKGSILSKYSNGTDILVGALTADEVAYAGATFSDDNTNNYLVNSYQTANSLQYWTLSPYNNNDYSDRVITVDLNGRLNNDSIRAENSVRPSVMLIPGIGITSGDGTKTNAYKIN